VTHRALTMLYNSILICCFFTFHWTKHIKEKLKVYMCINSYAIPFNPLIQGAVLSSSPVHGEVYSIQHYVIKRQLTITITIRIVADYIFVERHICLLSTGIYALTSSFRRRLVSRIFSKSHKVRSIYII
jgi:hypothetical protein